MDWFGWRLSKDPEADKSAAFGPQAILQELGKRVPQYLDDVDQGRLIYPACKRTPSDAHGDIGSIWDHTRLEAVRYVSMVPRREFEPLAEPVRQPDVLEAYRRQQPHEDTVIEFTGSAMSDLAIAIIAGFNWLNHCASRAPIETNSQARSATSGKSRALRGNGGPWRAPASAAARCWRKARNRR
jgi:hypothetical protein